MVLSLMQVVYITGAFFTVVGAFGFWLALSARKMDPAERSEKRFTEQDQHFKDQAAARLQQFEEDVNRRMSQLDAHIAQAHAQIDSHVASVR